MESNSAHGHEDVLAHLGRQFTSSPGTYEPSFYESDNDLPADRQLYPDDTVVDTPPSTYPPPVPHVPTAYPLQLNYGAGLNYPATYAQVAGTPFSYDSHPSIQSLNGHSLFPPHQLNRHPPLQTSIDNNQGHGLNHVQQVQNPHRDPFWIQQVQRVRQLKAEDPAILQSFRRWMSHENQLLAPTNPSYADVARVPTGAAFQKFPTQSKSIRLCQPRQAVPQIAINGVSSINAGHGTYLSPNLDQNSPAIPMVSVSGEGQRSSATSTWTPQQAQALVPFSASQINHNNPRSVNHLIQEVSRGGHRAPPVDTMTAAGGDGSASNSTPLSPSAISTSSSAQRRPRRTGAALFELDDINTEQCSICGRCYPPAEMRRHQRNHGTMEERAHRCDRPRCDQAFLYPKDLKRHQQRDHGLSESTPATSITCPYDCCARKTFGRSDALWKHLRKFHDGGVASTSSGASQH